MNVDLIVVGAITLALFGCWRLLQLEVKERRLRQGRQAAVVEAQHFMQQEAHAAEVPHKKPHYRSPEIEQRFF